MTSKEIIDGLEIYTVGRLNKDRVYVTVEELQKFIDAIKALEQEPKSEWEYDHEILKAYSDGANEVLDKIRAEIEEIAKDYDKFADYRRVRGLWIALKIIDKYKAERIEE